MKLSIALVLAVLLAAGCSQQQQSASDDASQGTKDAAVAETVPAPQSIATPAAAPAQGEVELAGTLGCGHCTYNVGESCTPALQTPDGVVYLLDGFQEKDEMFLDRQSGKAVKVVGAVADGDPHHMRVTSYEMMD